MSKESQFECRWQSLVQAFEQISKEEQLGVLGHIVLCDNCRARFDFLLFNQAKYTNLLGELISRAKESGGELNS